jgi:DNA-binding IclR family transcriptional regulator
MRTFSMSRTQTTSPPHHTASASPALRLTAEFLEMPGLRLTTQQTAKLIGVDVPTASNLLTALVQRGFLRVTSSGYVLA